MSERRTYRAIARRVDGWWAVEVADVPGAVTQTRRLDQVDTMAREVISLKLDTPPDSFDIDVLPQIGPTLDAEVDSARRAREAADRARANATESTQRAAVLLARDGLPLRDIGSLLGVSFQRAQQLVGQSALRQVPGRVRVADG
ncbi:MAG: hypothetical protein QM650_06000 [Microlunatus sp.]